MSSASVLTPTLTWSSSIANRTSWFECAAGSASSANGPAAAMGSEPVRLIVVTDGRLRGSLSWAAKTFPSSP
jgi:hypothetical protein